MALDRKRELFAHEYIKDLNGAAAARRVGVSPSTARFEASRMLAEPEVQDLVADLVQARRDAAKVDAERILAELVALAFFDPVHAYDETTNALKPIHEMPENVRKALVGVDVFEEFVGRGDARTHIGNTVKAKFADRGASLARLMKHLGMLKETPVNISVNMVDRLSRARNRTGGN